MPKKTVCEWFIKPLDDFTNEAIARLMADRCESDVSSLNFSLVDNQGESHDVWSVDYPVVATFQRSKQPVRFKVFTREGRSSPIRPWKFGVRRRQVKPKVHKRAVS